MLMLRLFVGYFDAPVENSFTHNWVVMSANDKVLSAEDVQAIAHLARLKIQEDSIPETVNNLSRIVDFVGQLEAVSVEDSEPMAHPLDLSQRLRVDAVTETDQREKFQGCAPDVSDGTYLVPKVMD